MFFCRVFLFLLFRQVHKMIFAMAELPGEFTTFDFIEGIPAPFNFGLAILLNQKMLTLAEKLQCAPALLPMLVEGQDFIDQQDELSVLEFMRKYAKCVFFCQNTFVCNHLHFTKTNRESESRIHVHARTERGRERAANMYVDMHTCIFIYILMHVYMNNMYM